MNTSHLLLPCCSYDGKFDLAKDAEDALKQLLASSTFAKQVIRLAVQLHLLVIYLTPFAFFTWLLLLKKLCTC